MPKNVLKDLHNQLTDILSSSFIPELESEEAFKSAVGFFVLGKLGTFFPGSGPVPGRRR